MGAPTRTSEIFSLDNEGALMGSKIMGLVVGALLVLATIYAYNKFSGSNVDKLGVG